MVLSLFCSCSYCYWRVEILAVARISAVAVNPTDVNILGILAMDRISAVAAVPSAVDVPSPAYVSNSPDIPTSPVRLVYLLLLAALLFACVPSVTLMLLLIVISILFPTVLATLLSVGIPWCSGFLLCCCRPFCCCRSVDLSAVDVESLLLFTSNQHLWRPCYSWRISCHPIAEFIDPLRES